MSDEIIVVRQTERVLVSAPGPQGPEGAAGAGGGTTWLDGTGVPASGLGANGNYYLEDATGDIYKKTAGTWSRIAFGGTVGGVILAPATTQVIQPTADIVPLQIKGKAGQTAALLELHDSAGTLLGWFGPLGRAIIGPGGGTPSAALEVRAPNATTDGLTVVGYAGTTNDLLRVRLDVNAFFRVTADPWLYLRNATAPGSNPTSGIYIYSEGGVLKYRNASGTIVVLDGSGGTPSSYETQIAVTAPTQVVATGDGQAYLTVTPALNGLNLVDAQASVTTMQSTQDMQIQIRRVRGGVSADMLSTKIHLDLTDQTSYTSGTPAVVNTSNDDVATGDLIAIDVDAAGTGGKGLTVILTFA